MGTNNVISLAQHRAAKLAAEVASPAIDLEPLEDETVDAFIERIGKALAEMISAPPLGGHRS